MLIKNTTLNFQITKPLSRINILIGQEFFQIQQVADAIKLKWQQSNPQEEKEIKIFQIETSADWLLLGQETSSYSLFTSCSLFDVRYDKKTLDSAGKTFLENYLSTSNPSNLLLLRAIFLPLKQLQALANQPHIDVIFSALPDKDTIKRWISQQLQTLGHLDQDSVLLIQQHTEGNLFACVQVLEKLKITKTEEPLTIQDIKEQLINQCDYPLFDFSIAYLTGNRLKILHLLQQAEENKTEPSLVLWLIAQEIRFLLQLLPCSSHQFKEAGNRLKIPFYRIKFYQSAFKKYNLAFLSILLQDCHQLDLKIKGNQSYQTWDTLRFLALSLCCGEKVGYAE